MDEDKAAAPKPKPAPPIEKPAPMAKTLEDVDDSLVPSDQPFAKPYEFSMIQMDMVTGVISKGEEKFEAETLYRAYQKFQ